MSIEIIPDPPVRITREQDERLRREYFKVTQYMVDPPSYETFVRSRIKTPSSPEDGIREARRIIYGI